MKKKEGKNILLAIVKILNVWNCIASVSVEMAIVLKIVNVIIAKIFMNFATNEKIVLIKL